jgi:hypothetical protein
VVLAISALGQSSSVDYPTPITSTEVSGKIKPRDLGDPRLTSHYYVFDAAQGDIFINIETTNLSGDIDVFYIGTLKPLTRISVYADVPKTQTGRSLYLRKSERLILRVEGRTPNDDPATYSIKFEGSFQAIADPASIPKDPNVLPELKKEDGEDTVVNSVGTIVEVKPKPSPTPKPVVARAPRQRTTRGRAPRPAAKPKAADKTDEPSSTNVAKSDPKEETQTPKPEVVVTDSTPETPVTTAGEPAAKPKPPTTRRGRTRSTKPPAAPKPKPVKDPQADAGVATKAPPPPNPLEAVKMTVVLKTGEWIAFKMSEILRTNVDSKGNLTITKKDGQVYKYQLLDVARVTIE